ncbi:MAG: hypothetical protein ACRDFQ_04510 [Anaerolineales bacterium]
MPNSKLPARIPALAIALAGAVHLVLAPQHFAHAPAHGVFFVLAGSAELAWATLFLRRPTKQLYYAGLALVGGLVALWAITRVLPAPFHGAAEPIDLGGIVSKISELAGLGALLMVAAQGGIAGVRKQSLSRLAATALLLSAAAGAASYGLGFAAEPLFPSLAAESHSEVEHHEEEHPHEEEHDHEEGKEHDHGE